MAAVQDLGDWGSICPAKFPVGLRENQNSWTTAAVLLQRDCVRTPLCFRCHLQCEVGAVPGGTGPPGAVPAERSLLVAAPPPGLAWDEPFPSLGAPHEEQDPAAASALCPPKVRGMSVCGQDTRHFCLSSATVTGHTNKNKDRKWVVYTLKDKYFIFQAQPFSRLDLGLHFQASDIFDGLFHFQILAGSSLRYARSMMR